MAAVTTAAIGVASSGYQIYKGAQDAKDAKEALNNFERQELTNVYENMPISTLGSDLIKEENSRISSTQVNALRQSGIRGILGGIPKIQSENNRSNLQAQRLLDDQVIKRNYAISRDNQRIQGVQEQRDNADLAGIGQQLQTGRQNTFNGIRGVGNSLIYGANNIDFGGGTGSEQGLDDFELQAEDWNVNTEYRSNIFPR